MSKDEVVTELSMTYSFMMHLILEGDDDKQLFESVLHRDQKINIVCVWGADNVGQVIHAIDDIKRDDIHSNFRNYRSRL
jgi:hypothetical protein